MTATIIDDPSTIYPLKIGGGGYATGHAQHADGTLYCWTDSSGGYKWNAGTSTWDLVVSTDTIPSGEHVRDIPPGVVHMAIAPSNSSIVYLRWGAAGEVYKSTDGAASFTKMTAITGDTSNANSQVYRRYSHRMTVDPTNPDIVYVNNSNKTAWRTQDGAVTWSQMTDITTATGANGVWGIHIDPTSSTLSSPTRKAKVWVFADGDGYYLSTDGGDNFSLTSSGPTSIYGSAMGANGHLWTTSSGSGTSVWHHDGSSWSSSNCGLAQHADIAIDPNDNDRIIMQGFGIAIVETTNAGSSWGSPLQTSGVVGFDYNTIPWLGLAEQYNTPSTGHFTFDTQVQNKIIYTAGLGVWTTTLAPEFTSVTWTEMTEGMEQLVCYDIVQPIGSKRIYFAGMDKNVFTIGNPDVYPWRHAIEVTGTGDGAGIIHAFQVAYEPGNPKHLIASTNYGMLRSREGGRYGSWSYLPVAPDFSSLGVAQPRWTDTPYICMLSADDYIGFSKTTAGVWRTHDAGATWTECTFPGGVTAVKFHNANLRRRFTLCADSQTAGTAYIYANDFGVYKTTDYGVNWTQGVTDPLGDGSYTVVLKCNPLVSGHLMITASDTSPGSGVSQFFQSFDGGANFTRIGIADDILEVVDFAFGAVTPGETDPALYIIGYVNGASGLEYGIFKNKTLSDLTTTNSGTWYKKSGGFPGKRLGNLFEIEASWYDDELWFAGYPANGAVYGANAPFSDSAQTLTLLTE